ncbi:hypothetical protein BU25DRAFT_327272, partial [Macroventuria anomochaeta]
LSRRRLRTSSYKICIVSLAGLHTETLNIWTHLLGAVWFVCSTIRFAAACANPLARDAAAVLVYLGATALCFTSSTLYHVFADHVHADAWLRIDHFGIACVIWASSVSFVLFSFDCRRGEGWTYIALVTAAAALCLARLWDMQGYSTKGRLKRLSTHIAFGGLAAVPGLRCWHLHKQGQHVQLLKEFWSLVAINSTGGGIYATHLLDKAIGMELGLPDASHHVMHVMVFAGAWIYGRGLLAL